MVTDSSKSSSGQRQSRDRGEGRDLALKAGALLTGGAGCSRAHTQLRQRVYTEVIHVRASVASAHVHMLHAMHQQGCSRRGAGPEKPSATRMSIRLLASAGRGPTRVWRACGVQNQLCIPIQHMHRAARVETRVMSWRVNCEGPAMQVQIS